MAISMSSARVETGERDSLRTSTVDTSITSGGATANVDRNWLSRLSGGLFGTENPTGAKLAGVTASFATNVTNEIDSYCNNVNQCIDKISQVEFNTAFKGSQIEAALNNFIESVKTVAKSYTSKLKAAESEIINSVAQAYQTQDADLSGNLGSDSSSLEGNSVN